MQSFLFLQHRVLAAHERGSARLCRLQRMQIVLVGRVAALETLDRIWTTLVVIDDFSLATEYFGRWSSATVASSRARSFG